MPSLDYIIIAILMLFAALVMGAGDYQPSQYDIEACVESSNYTKIQCEKELLR